MLKCLGCEVGHDEIEQVSACESAWQTEVRRQLDAEADALPKRDGRFTTRGAGYKKSDIAVRTKPVTVQYELTIARRGQITTTIKERTFVSEKAMRGFFDRHAGSARPLRYDFGIAATVRYAVIRGDGQVVKVSVPEE